VQSRLSLKEEVPMSIISLQLRAIPGTSRNPEPPAREEKQDLWLYSSSSFFLKVFYPGRIRKTSPILPEHGMPEEYGA